MNRSSSLWPLLLILGLAACGEDEAGGGGPSIDCGAFDPPQILPVQQPICLSYDPTEVGDTASRGALLQNFGNNDLVISDAMLTGNARSHLRIQGAEVNMPIACPEAAAIGLVYEPSEPGWDTATLVVTSNAQNFPTLNIFLLALAVPENDPNYDPGPKPPEALVDGDACPDM